MTRSIRFEVAGLPQPKGSKRAFKHPNGGALMVVESNAAKQRPWRQDVTAMARASMHGEQPMRGPVTLMLTFYLPRPKSHYGTGKNAATLKPSAPLYPASRPDWDKLARLVGDCLKVAGVYIDDGQVVNGSVFKRFGPPGVSVCVQESGPPNEIFMASTYAVAR